MDEYKTIQFKEVKIMEITIKGTEEEIKNLLHITEKESDKEQNLGFEFPKEGSITLHANRTIETFWEDEQGTLHHVTDISECCGL